MLRLSLFGLGMGLFVMAATANCSPIFLQVIDPEHLSVQLYEEENQVTLYGLMESIADTQLKPLHVASDPAIGQYCLALYREDCMYYRARIEAVNREQREVEVR